MSRRWIEQGRDPRLVVATGPVLSKGSGGAAQRGRCFSASLIAKSIGEGMGPREHETASSSHRVAASRRRQHRGSWGESDGGDGTPTWSEGYARGRSPSFYHAFSFAPGPPKPSTTIPQSSSSASSLCAHVGKGKEDKGT
uniref:Uncharacterized protein n=1 Tax=Oryza nivara TaxID=4536 RepID=A0A0E0J8X2_ORYNI